MTFRFSQILFFIVLNIFSFAAAEETFEITVKAEKKQPDETSREEKKNEDIERKQFRTLSEALSDMSGVHLTGDNSSGTPKAIYIHGLRSEYALVLLDGVRLNDEMSAAGSAALDGISVTGLRKITLIKGPSTVLYGGDALSGTILLESEEKKDGNSLKLRLESGAVSLSDNKTLNSLSTSASFNSGNKNKSFSLSGSANKNSADSASDKGNEKDGFSDINLNIATRYKTGKESELFIRSHFLFSQAQIDDGAGKEDINRMNTRKLFTIRPQFSFSSFKAKMKTDIYTSVALREFEDTDPPEPYITFDSDGLESTFSSLTLTAGGNSIIRPFRDFILETGAELRNDSGYSETFNDDMGKDLHITIPEHRVLNLDTFVNAKYRILKKVKFSGGVRYNLFAYDNFSFSSDRAEKTSEKLTSSFMTSLNAVASLPESFYIRAGFGNGVKNPSLYQLYSKYRNMENGLKPQKGISAGLGFGKNKNRMPFGFEVSYFINRIKNQIDYSYAKERFENRYKTESDGIETNIFFTIVKHIDFEAGYMWLSNMKEYTLYPFRETVYKYETEILRRPKHTFKSSLFFQNDKTVLGLSLKYTGERKDIVYELPRTPYITNLDSYLLLNIYASYSPVIGIKFFGRVENILNVDYSEVYGYKAHQLSFFIGVQYEGS